MEIYKCTKIYKEALNFEKYYTMSKRYPLDFKRHTGHKLKTQLLPQSKGAHPTLKFTPMWFLPILQPVCKPRSQAMAAMAGSLAGYTAA